MLKKWIFKGEKKTPQKIHWLISNKGKIKFYRFGAVQIKKPKIVKIRYYIFCYGTCDWYGFGRKSNIWNHTTFWHFFLFRRCCHLVSKIWNLENAVLLFKYVVQILSQSWIWTWNFIVYFFFSKTRLVRKLLLIKQDECILRRQKNLEKISHFVLTLHE